MDVQISSNFERLLFDVLNEDDKQVSTFMSDLKSKGSFLKQRTGRYYKKRFQCKKKMIKKLLK